MRLTINCDMGEGFGLYRLGDDAAMMPHIDLANVACGFHASDPPTMRETVRLAKSTRLKSARIHLCPTCRALAVARWSFHRRK